MKRKKYIKNSEGKFRRSQGKLISYLEGDLGFDQFVRETGTQDTEAYHYIIFHTGIYQIRKSIYDYNTLRGLLILLAKNNYDKPICEELLNLEQTDFFKRLLTINPLLKMGYTHIISNRNG